MSTLFTVNRSWHQAPWLFEKLGYASKGDTILLLEDGVLALQSNVALSSFLAKCVANEVLVVALQPDLITRGVDSKYQVEQVSFAEFVQLVASHDKQVAW